MIYNINIGLSLFTHTNLVNININIGIFLFLNVAASQNLAFAPGASIRINTAYVEVSAVWSLHDYLCGQYIPSKKDNIERGDLVIDVCMDIYVMMSSDLYGTCSHCFNRRVPYSLRYLTHIVVLASNSG